jgi:hypothetical protein
MTRKAVIVVASVLSLVGVGVWAQTPLTPLQIPEARRPALGHESAVLSGQDIGIRLTGSVDRDGRIQGTLVAKVNGKWVDVASAPRAVGASQ